MQDIALAFLWHQHQPYYPDDVSGENPMPWVRLHGVKDYYGMALHLREVPEMHATINLVPSLLLQLTAYTERGAQDDHLRVSAAAGRRADRSRHAVPARPLLHGQPGPHDPCRSARYAELYQRRGLVDDPAAEAAAPLHRRATCAICNAGSTSPGFTRWPSRRTRTWPSSAPRAGHFTEDEKQWLLDKHLEILRRSHAAAPPAGRERPGRADHDAVLPPDPAAAVRQEAGPRGHARRRSCPLHAAAIREDAAVHVRRAVE